MILTYDWKSILENQPDEKFAKFQDFITLTTPSYRVTEVDFINEIKMEMQNVKPIFPLTKYIDEAKSAILIKI